MPVRIFSACMQGFAGATVQVDADVARGLPAFHIVGLGDSCVQESKERVRSAIKNSGRDFPMNRKTVNLAPAHLKKHGPAYDLPIAVSLLAASGQIPATHLSGSIFIGELGLDGLLRPVSGILPITSHAKKFGFRNIFIPFENVSEASLIRDIEIYGISNLAQLILHLRDEEVIESAYNVSQNFIQSFRHEFSDFSSLIKGQHQAKRALLIAAAGNHHLLMSGPPGVGKTLLGKFLAELLPPLCEEELISVTSIHSIKGLLKDENRVLTTRPFREIHQTISAIGLIGGGADLMPGEISLAHCGVLFLDEMNEFPRQILETLRQPLEEKEIRIQRARGAVEYPANFLLAGTMNPCPCGFYGSNKACLCSLHALESHRKKLSGPLLDRIDLFIRLENVQVRELFCSKREGCSSQADSIFTISEMRRRILAAREIQYDRYRDLSTRLNGDLKLENLFLIDRLDLPCRKFLEKICMESDLSPRSSHRLLKTARTIADLDEAEAIEEKHLFEALQYTLKGCNPWTSLS